LDKVVVNNSAYIDNSIIGWKSQIGQWSRIENNSILGEEVVIHPEVSLNAAIVLPNVPVKVNVKDSIIMY
jgi:mannose-1-phosphate guanylyltransferase